MLVWSVLFSILPKCLFVTIIMYAYFIDISQGSVKTRSQCGGICNNCVIANFCRVCQWKNCENWSIIGEDMEKVPRCFGPPCIVLQTITHYASTSAMLWSVDWLWWLTVHIHAGNVIIDGDSCRLLDLENSLLGLPTLHRRVYSQLHKLHVSCHTTYIDSCALLAKFLICNLLVNNCSTLVISSSWSFPETMAITFCYL